MTNDLSNLGETLRTLDDIREDIEKIERYTNFDDSDVFEQHGKQYYLSQLEVLLTLRHAHLKKKEKFESS
jgi:hypothetical protein